MSDFKIEEIGGILDTVSEKVPRLIRELLNSLYSPEAGMNMGKAVGNLYKELVDSGIPNDEAMKMARDYMLSIKDVMNPANSQEKK